MVEIRAENPFVAMRQLEQMREELFHCPMSIAKKFKAVETTYTLSAADHYDEKLSITASFPHLLLASLVKAKRFTVQLYLSSFSCSKSTHQSHFAEVGNCLAVSSVAIKRNRESLF